MKDGKRTLHVLYLVNGVAMCKHLQTPYRLYVYDVRGFVAHVLKSMPIVQTTEVSALQSRSREDDVWAGIRTLLRFKLDSTGRPHCKFEALMCVLHFWICVTDFHLMITWNDFSRWRLAVCLLSFLWDISADLVHVYPLSKPCTERYLTRTPLKNS